VKFHDIISNFFNQSGIYLPLLKNHADIDGLIKVNLKWWAIDLKIVTSEALNLSLGANHLAIWLYANQASVRFSNNVRFFLIVPAIRWCTISLLQLNCLVQNYLTAIRV
jgi:hypothetical protein